MISIRKAEIEDVDVIHDLGKSVSEFAVNEETATFWPKDILVLAVGSSDTLILVAETD